MMVSYQEATKIVEEQFKGKQAPKLHFIIAYGPPGSGKSSSLTDAFEHLQIPQNSVIHVDIDALIQSTQAYRTQCVPQQNVYMRQNCYDTLRKIMNPLSTQVLNHAFLDRFHIVFKTTGLSIYWTFREIGRARFLGYTITVVFPLVPLKTLIDRTQRRQQETKHTAAPPERIEATIKKSLKNIYRLFHKIDQLLVYNNAGTKDQLKLVMQLTKTDGIKQLVTSVNGPGVQINRSCECSSIREMRKKLSAELMSLFNICACDQDIKKMWQKITRTEKI